jgi:hypothetical protein
MATMVANDSSYRKMARLSTSGGEDNFTRLGANKLRYLIASLFNSATRFTGGSVTSRGITDHSMLPRLHCLDYFVAPWRRRSVIEVVLATHATKYDLAFVNSRMP